MRRKLFVTFEGIDGSGKDTQLLNLIEEIKNGSIPELGDKYSTVWVTREPTKITDQGKKISELLKGEEISGEETTKYFVEDRKQHSQIIKQILNHSIVLCSRYDFSTLTYQMTQGMDFEKLYNLHEYHKGECLIPDITLVFDLPADEALNRTKKRNHAQEFFEVIEFQEKLEKNIKKCIDLLHEKDKRKIIVINANQSIDKVTREMIEKIKQSLMLS